MQNEKGLEPYLVNALSSRGVTHQQHQVKMANLAKLKDTVIKAIRHDYYLVNGQHYNPYTDKWTD